MVISLSPDMLCNDGSFSVFRTNAPLVLIADDDDLIRLVLRQAMEDEGYQVAEAHNGQACIEQYAALHPAIVLLDGKMPVMDGFTCCAMLHERYGDATAPILMLTSLDNVGSIEQAFAVGVTDYITKPFNWAILSQRIRRLLKESAFKKQSNQTTDTVELRVKERPDQLQHAVTLNQITERLHASLDEAEILSATAQELAWALKERYYTGIMVDGDLTTVYSQDETTDLTPDSQALLRSLIQDVEIEHQIIHGQLTHVCLVTPDDQNRVSILVSPIALDDTLFGTLWLIGDEAQMLTEQDTQLVKQIANHCAIALHNARHHQSCQRRVKELERLNQGKDEFLSAVVHELRSPLANMRLATHALERLLNIGQEAQDAIADHAPNFSKSLNCLKILDSECEKELSLINELLDFQRLESGQESWNEVIPVPLPDWISNTAETFEERIRLQNQTLQLEISPQLPEFLFTNPRSLERVLRELITNACKYSPPGEKITIALYTEAQTLHLSVVNSGVEIPQSEFSRIFTRFYRIPNSDRWQQGGTGLGLELVKRLVESINGSIEVESSQGQCCFTVKLPL